MRHAMSGDTDRARWPDDGGDERGQQERRQGQARQLPEEHHAIGIGRWSWLLYESAVA